MRAAVGDTLAELGRKNEKIVVIDAETAVATNIMPFKNEFPERFLTTCIAEQNAISVAYECRGWDISRLYRYSHLLSLEDRLTRFLFRLVMQMQI